MINSQDIEAIDTGRKKDLFTSLTIEEHRALLVSIGTGV